MHSFPFGTPLAMLRNYGLHYTFPISFSFGCGASPKPELSLESFRLSHPNSAPVAWGRIAWSFEPIYNFIQSFYLHNDSMGSLSYSSKYNIVLHCLVLLKKLCLKLGFKLFLIYILYIREGSSFSSF